MIVLQNTHQVNAKIDEKASVQVFFPENMHAIQILVSTFCRNSDRSAHERMLFDYTKDPQLH